MVLLRFLLYGLILYLFINYIIKPIFSALTGDKKPKEGSIHYKKNAPREDKREGEYIDYEEVDDDDHQNEK